MLLATAIASFQAGQGLGAGSLVYVNNFLLTLVTINT
jgi:hypothetical protein